MKKWNTALLCAALLALLCACTAAENEPPEEGFLLYFLVPEDRCGGGDKLQGSLEQLYLPEEASLLETARAVVERLLAGPEDGALESPVPAGVELAGLEIWDRQVYVDFSSTYGQLGGVELALADYCVTLSLTALEGVSAVSITADGRPLRQQPKQVFYERDVLLSSMDDVLQTAEVTLYFPDSENALTGEKRTLELYEGQTLAENLVAALLEGPQNRELVRVIPEDFQINFVRVENGVCTLSISASSLEALPEDVQRQQLILWSLADSLYSIDAISSLRLLSGGQELASFGAVPVEIVAARPAG